MPRRVRAPVGARNRKNTRSNYFNNPRSRYKPGSANDPFYPIKQVKSQSIETVTEVMIVFSTPLFTVLYIIFVNMIINFKIFVLVDWFCIRCLFCRLDLPTSDIFLERLELSVKAKLNTKYHKYRVVTILILHLY